MLDRRRKDLPRLVEIVAGEQHAIDLHAVLGPLLDLVVVAVVRLKRVEGFFVGLPYCGWIVLWVADHACRFFRPLR